MGYPNKYFGLNEDKDIYNISVGDVLEGTVTNIQPYGVFVRLENNQTGLLHIENISVARIKSPAERFEIGQKINVMVKLVDRQRNRIDLTYKELLGTWEENVEDIKEGMTIKGIARETEKSNNGIFIEMKPNLVGLAEYKNDVVYGQEVDVYIKKIIPEKKKIKLILI